MRKSEKERREVRKREKCITTVMAPMKKVKIERAKYQTAAQKRKFAAQKQKFAAQNFRKKLYRLRSLQTFQSGRYIFVSNGQKFMG